MKLDFNFTLKTLEEKEFSDKATANSILADRLATVSSSRIKVMDAFEYAKKLSNGEVIDLISNQQDDFKYFIENEMKDMPLIKAQLLEVFKKEPKKVEDSAE